jgi:hypothetical protein
MTLHSALLRMGEVCGQAGVNKNWMERYFWIGKF